MGRWDKDETDKHQKLTNFQLYIDRHTPKILKRLLIKRQNWVTKHGFLLSPKKYFTILFSVVTFVLFANLMLKDIVYIHYLSSLQTNIIIPVHSFPFVGYIIFILFFYTFFSRGHGRGHRNNERSDDDTKTFKSIPGTQYD